MTDTVLVTGAAGFIGSNFVRHVLAHTGLRVVAYDKLTYAGNLASLADVASDPRFSFIEADIADRRAVESALAEARPTALVNFAAETHVDRSIDGPAAFVQTNLVGTFELLDASRRFLTDHKDLADRFRFVHVSTDEVYGSLGPTGLFVETTPYAPNSPYAATKAGADHLVRSYFETFKLPAIITNCSNNYGPYQFPEKLIPLMVLNAIDGKNLPVYGDGKNVRDWLFVEDHCAGVLAALQRGRPGERYNIGGNNEQNNTDVVRSICSLVDSILPASENASLKARGAKTYADLITFVEDRPGHDRRYAIDATKIKNELGWVPKHDFASGLRQTIEWYVKNRAWCETVQQGKNARARVGLGATSGEKK
jgi:dTDP-glucose 4,6-dehydratase